MCAICLLIYPEPLLPSHPDEIADISKLVSTPIALGERLYSRYEFRPYFEKRAIDIAQPDVSLILAGKKQLIHSSTRFLTVGGLRN